MGDRDLGIKLRTLGQYLIVDFTAKPKSGLAPLTMVFSNTGIVDSSSMPQFFGGMPTSGHSLSLGIPVDSLNTAPDYQERGSGTLFPHIYHFSPTQTCGEAETE
jgi:hypothetical protein